MTGLNALRLFFLLASLLQAVRLQQTEKCAQNIDLVFALDASGSVKETGYEQIKKFTKDIIDQFEIGVVNTHVAVVTFSEYAEVQLKFTDSFDKQEIFDKIDRLDYPGYRTATDDALRVVNKDVLSVSGGGRQGVAQVLILLTDGRCTVCEENVETAVAPLKARGVTIYTVGVTNEVNRTELALISSEPTDQYSFEVSAFGELASIIVDVYSKACLVKKGKCAKPLSPFQCTGLEEDVCFGDGECEGDKKCCSVGCLKKCTYPLLNCMTAIDIAFAIDSSNSVRDDAFIKMKRFAKDIVDSFTVSQKDARFASLSYSDDAEVNFNFVRHSTADKVKRAIDALPHKKSDTRVDKALELAASDIFSLQGGVRTRRPMVLIVFFDGDISRDMKDLKEVAAPLKAYGVKIVAVGVGPEVNTYQLNKIASSSEVIFKARTFKDLLPELYSIAEETCSEKPGECPAKVTPKGECNDASPDECQSDFDCYGAGKCCNSGCNTKCVLPVEVCKRKVDIAFGIHQNIAENEFNILKYFLEDSMQRFEISPKKSHVALISYGSESEVVFDFNADQDFGRVLKRKIDQLAYRPGQGSLVDVLAVACEKIFCVAGGTRDNVAKMLVLVTGPSSPSNPEELNQRIKTLRSQGVDVLIFGVGDVDSKVLRSVTSDRPEVVDRVLLSKDYGGILQYGQDIPDFACAEAGSVKVPEEKCKEPTTCLKGAKGGRGQQGTFGKRGSPGVRGPNGKGGIRGPRGQHGDDGRRGVFGDQGGQGLIGLPGFSGYDGIPGVPGVIGRPGPCGDCGKSGEAGEAGDAGVDGFPGPPGYQGTIGPKGAKGKPTKFDPNLVIERGNDGDPGEAGLFGRKGVKGALGPDGVEGDEGTDGVAGPLGEDGKIGDPGVSTSFQKGKTGYQGDRGDPGPPASDYATGGHINGTTGARGEPGTKGVTGSNGSDGKSSEVKGIKGRKGAQGDEGEIGETGVAGKEGESGLSGNKGQKGAGGGRGEDGLNGPIGFPGTRGDVGLPGLPGEQGRRGDQGTGTPGLEGKKGPLGGVGDAGLPGEIGEEGPAGATGNQGDDGSAGPVGDEGPVGVKGQPGLVGSKGETGESGDGGSRGESGDQGQKGDTGMDSPLIEGDGGKPGEQGKRGESGGVGPPGLPGSRGPTTTADCVENKCPGLKKGAVGRPGDTGETGPAGPAGKEGMKGHPGGPCPTCPTGQQGVSGQSGFPGRPGSKGMTGSDGDPGAAGKKGEPGLTQAGDKGLKGINGIKGEVGKRGRKGPDAPGDKSFAPEGEQGAQGSDGPNGARGSTGLKGVKGTNGTSGPEGKRGEEGIKGMAGQYGLKGKNGKNGSPGKKGENGESVKGDVGEPGAIGDEGKQGQTGQPGEEGQKGEKGREPTEEEKQRMKELTPGEKGIQGADGDNGDGGIQGRKGENGPRGPQGKTGKRGERGSGGVVGDVGEEGKDGDDGDPGPRGFPGRFGKRGLPGVPGKPGLSGDQGIKGEKGDNGTGGPSGRRGKDTSINIGCVNSARFDIGFLLDSSKSVNAEDFRKQKDFIREILREFPIGRENSLAGVIKYGAGANIEIRFSDYDSSTDLLEAVDRIQHNEARESRLDLALQIAENELFTRRAGSRVGDQKTKKALVILGDGFISGGGILGKRLSDSAVEYANGIKGEDIMVFSLAVGAEKNRYLLQNFVSNPAYYLDVPTYDFLSQKIEDLKAALSLGCTNTTLQKGEPGSKGKPGPAGSPGLQGEQGADGEQGVGGIPGLFGSKGLAGDAGDGTQGNKGVEGLAGHKGEPGLPGVNGEWVAGPAGKRGAKGEVGVPKLGRKGVQGEQGSAGPRGPDSKQKLCNYVLATDVVFLLDTSSGVGKENFEKMKIFMKNIVKSFDVDSLMTRVSVMTYDVDARLNIKLSDHNNVNSLFKSIDRLQYTSGELTRIDKVLIKANDVAWAEENGGRVGVNRAIVLMTDGQQSYAPDQVAIPDAVKPLIDNKTLRYAIGIGTEISPVELKVVAGDNVVLADDFDSLVNKIETQVSLIGQRGCKGADGPPGRIGESGMDGIAGVSGQSGEPGIVGSEGPTGFKGRKGEPGVSEGTGRKGENGDLGDAGPPGLPGCNDKTGRPVETDIGFVVDASASLYKEGFQTEIDFINKVIDAVGPISAQSIRAGVIVYSDVANLRIKFDDHFNSADLKDAVNSLPYDDVGETRIDLGLLRAKDLFTKANGGRDSSKKVLILMTDGQQTYVPGIKEPSDIAEQLSGDGIEILAVGIGAEVARVDLESYTSKPEFLFLASDFESLVNQLVAEVSQALTCEGGPRGPQGRAGDDGEPGDQGKLGLLGDAGRKGEDGEAGPGPVGDKGEKGDRGTKGALGQAGFRGADGPEGPRGPIGNQGNAGPSGVKGETGYDGFVGNDGPKGAAGLKGEKGSGSGTNGGPGKVGEDGDEGLKGVRGDKGVLTPGTTIDDLKGDAGENGEPGPNGGQGSKGRILMAPGDLGIQGEEGVKGDPGSFGKRGENGEAGPRGAKGESGIDGVSGNKGDDGFPGLDGKTGTDGDPGFNGITRNGESGEKGSQGVLGDVGDEGEPGYFGLIGFSGRKGDRGEAGKRGKQQTRTIQPEDRKGRAGDDGPIGDDGEDGDVGEKGEGLPGPSGPSGEKGKRGGKGEQGDIGGIGLVGLDGFGGEKGQPGKIGSDGDPGAAGTQGATGEIGDIQGGGEPGDIGDIGLIGLTGRPGIRGQKGILGDTGKRGDDGEKGIRGQIGFPGLVGQDGPDGPQGNQGGSGNKGVTGLSGISGPGGATETGENSGYYVVRHSQSAYVPTCPRNYEVLWEGYSLMYTVGNGHAHSQDLGDAGSCSRSFSTLPFIFCSITNTCHYASRNDFTYWLSGDVTQPMMPVTNSAVEPFISRCVVCNAPDVSIAVHSQDVQSPQCPVGYDSLWTGFSFLMVAAAGKTGAGQSLGSSGSCLEEFRPKPFIECEGARGTCHFFSDKFSFWLITIDKSREFQTQTPVTLSKNKGDDLTSRVSKCRVCIRTPGKIDENVPEAGFLRRVARSVGSWFGAKKTSSS